MSDCDCERWQRLCEDMNKRIDSLLGDLKYLGATYTGETLTLNAKKYHEVYRKGLDNLQKLQMVREYTQDVMSSIAVEDMRGRSEVISMLWAILNEVNAIENKTLGSPWAKLKSSGRVATALPPNTSKDSSSDSETKSPA